MSYKNEKTTNFTHQHFSDYLKGELSLDDKYLFERKLRNDPFFKDAYEGFKSNPASFSALSRLERKKKKFNSNYLAIGFVSLFVVFFVAGFFYFIQQSEKSNEAIAFNEIENSFNIRKIEKHETQNDSENLPIPVTKTVKQTVVYTQIVEEEKRKERTNEIVVFNAVNEVTKKEPLVYVEHKKKLKKIETSPSLEIETNLVPLVSIHGLINVNYEKIEDNITIEVQQFIINGTPANKENQDTKFTEPSHQVQLIKVPYVNYLSDIQFDFSHNKFKKAIKGYKKVLEQYPNDLNAHFYISICYYNLNQSEKALAHLGVVQTHRFDTFRQEGNWYKASVLYDLGRREECIELLDAIIKKKGF